MYGYLMELISYDEPTHLGKYVKLTYYVDNNKFQVCVCKAVTILSTPVNPLSRDITMIDHQNIMVSILSYVLK